MIRQILPALLGLLLIPFCSADALIAQCCLGAQNMASDSADGRFRVEAISLNGTGHSSHGPYHFRFRCLEKHASAEYRELSSFERRWDVKHHFNMQLMVSPTGNGFAVEFPRDHLTFYSYSGQKLSEFDTNRTQRLSADSLNDKPLKLVRFGKVAAGKVTEPPEEYFNKVRESDRQAARDFYKKYIDIGGLPCTAGADVDDQALLRTYEIVTHMLANRTDVIEAMSQFGTRLIIIGKDQVYTDMPEYRKHPNPAFQNERVRGTGGLDVTSFGEENLLNLALDRYDDESIAVHEFCHTIDAALARIERDWRARRNATYQHAVDMGLYKYAYAGSNSGEYWAEICQAYFDCNRINNWNHSAIGTREQLKEYDPQGYELVRGAFRLTPENDWRFKPLQTQPSVIVPPAKFSIPAHYTKFSWAREFLVVGSADVSDAALLIANDKIRKMFAYRHDLLKVLINDGGRVVVLAHNERLTDLPEFAAEKSENVAATARCFDYSQDKKIIVVPEENLLATSSTASAGKHMLIGQLAKAVLLVAGARDADEKFAIVRRDSQQYEQRLLWNKSSEPIARMDAQFMLKVRDLFAQAIEKKRWIGTPAARDPSEYWAAGVEAYFDATGRGYPPVNAEFPVSTREQLKSYDPELFALVHSTMLYAGHPDWRVR